jgi:putative DNA primase/helicase
MDRLPVTAAEIAAARGGARRVGRWWSCRCPAHDDQSPSLSLRDGDRGLIVRCWAGCDTRDVLAELRRLWLTGDDCRIGDTTDKRPDDRPDGARRIEFARRIWGAARDARGTPVAHYLAARAIIVPPPSSLRWAGSLRRPDGTHGPAMIARVDGLDGDLIAVHRTYLERDASGVWRRRDRASLGPVSGGAVRLAPAAETLLVGEGIETCLAAMQATAQPAWAALSTSGMAALLLPAEVRSVIILADYDCSGAGERAARTAAQRWLAEGRRIRIAMPPGPGTDFADVLAGRAHPRIEEARDAAA